MRDFKGRLGLGGGQGVDGRYLFEELDDEDEGVEVEGYNGADDVGCAPMADEMEAVTRENCTEEDDRRQDADDDGRTNTFERKHEAGDGGQRCRDEKHGGHAVEAFRGKHAEDDDESGGDADEVMMTCTVVKTGNVIPRIMANPFERRRLFVECDYWPSIATPPRLPWAMRARHSAGPVLWTLVPLESTATVTGMSRTSNS